VDHPPAGVIGAASRGTDYRVLDALIDPQAGVKLVVPSMENIGQLRQSAPICLCAPKPLSF